jgi:hypothetical protein
MKSSRRLIQEDFNTENIDKTELKKNTGPNYRAQLLRNMIY